MDWGEFDRWWYKQDNTKEFGHCIRQMTDEQLYAAWEHALIPFPYHDDLTM